jgi:uncharacterized membrane protein
MDMTTPGRIVVGVIVVAAIVCEIVAFFAYRNSVDGQAGVLNLILAIYAVLAIALVWGIDRLARSLGARRNNRHAHPGL